VKTRVLGKARVKISELGFGGWAIGGDGFGNGYGATSDAESRAAIGRALELGVTFFDTADIYGHGHSEALIGDVLAEWPGSDKVVVCTKGGVDFYRSETGLEYDLTPYGLANAVQRSLDRLRRPKIDIYLLMNPPIGELLATDRVWQSLGALQRADKIGAFGVSVSDPHEAVALLEHGAPVDVIEVAFSIFDQGAVTELLPLARTRRVGIIAREPLANGFLTGKYAPRHPFPPGDHRAQLPREYADALADHAQRLRFLATPRRTMAQAALRFALDEPGIGTVVVGARTAEQVEENIAACDLDPLTDDERMAIETVFE
jgi:aryl-alcohol dehydrogenase-like predicted oxidoreductase